ncbi:peroxisomal assembly protein [Perkinsus chesapeaki]|uniref:Peroxisomal assembly protein n=1 Tax=Perkinsus chesapeaki TaxID=330153 RepID=A0A7J6L7L0_PERCH|nr:peroxisomal assembly protein [Perkinsus chesapeaki]
MPSQSATKLQLTPYRLLQPVPLPAGSVKLPRDTLSEAFVSRRVFEILCRNAGGNVDSSCLYGYLSKAPATPAAKTASSRWMSDWLRQQDELMASIRVVRLLPYPDGLSEAVERKCFATPEGSMALHLPPPILASLRLTVGKSKVTCRPSVQCPLKAKSIQMVEVSFGPTGVRDRAVQSRALGELLRVPRLFKVDELIGVPVWGLRRSLCAIEGVDMVKLREQDAYDLFDSSGPESAPRDWFSAHRRLIRGREHPVYGSAFVDMVYFRITQATLENGQQAGTDELTFSVSAADTEVIMKTRDPKGATKGWGAVPLLPAYFTATSRSLDMLPHLAAASKTIASAISLGNMALVTGDRGSGKLCCIREAGNLLGLATATISCGIDAKTVADIFPIVEELLKGRMQRRSTNRSALLVLRDVSELFPTVAESSQEEMNRTCRVVSGSLKALRCKLAEAGVALSATSQVIDLFETHVGLPRADDSTREDVISRMLLSTKLCLPLEIKTIREGTAGLSIGDTIGALTRLALLPKGCDEADAKKALRDFQQRVSGSTATVMSGVKVHWDDVGGMDEAKRELRHLLSSIEAKKQGKAGKLRTGILLFGPPGTGKTLLAKAVATESRASFVSVKGPELLSMYIGESEKNVREVFQRAVESRPSVVFFDEVDSLAPHRGRGSDSGGVMDRVVASLLAEIDNLPSDVIVIAASNRPDLLDRALLRPGRLDRQVFLGVSDDKLPLVEAITAHMTLSGDMKNSLRNIADLMPRTFTGADVAGACRAAHIRAVKRQTARLDSIAESIAPCGGVSAVRELQLLIEECKSKHILPNSSLTESACLCSIDSAVEMACSGPPSFLKAGTCSRCNCQCVWTDRGLERVEEGLGDLLKVAVQLEDFREALSGISPSVTAKELERYEQMRREFANI